LTYFFSIQPGPRTGRTDACGSPITTIGTISLLAKLAICLPLHLLRCTTRSFELARDQNMRVRGLEQTCGSGLGSPLPSSRRSAGADLEAYGFSCRFA
jgi:hypothetical protein